MWPPINESPCSLNVNFGGHFSSGAPQVANIIVNHIYRQVNYAYNGTKKRVHNLYIYLCAINTSGVAEDETMRISVVFIRLS